MPGTVSTAALRSCAATVKPWAVAFVTTPGAARTRKSAGVRGCGSSSEIQTAPAGVPFGVAPSDVTLKNVWRGMFTSDPRVAVNGSCPSISTRTSPSTTANHSRVSGWKRALCLVPGAADT